MREPPHVRRSLVMTALVVLGCAGAIVARRPDVLVRPQFWAEDGMQFYARAYQEPGLATLLAPYGACYQTFPRLAGFVAQWVAFPSAPLAMALLALLVQALPPAFLLSQRCAGIAPHAGQRALRAAGVLLVPNAMEVHVNVTNAQVHLGFLVLLAAPPDRPAWRAFDVSVLLLSGASGPFCLLLLPVAVLCCWRQRDRWSFVRLLCVLAPAVLQLAALAPRGPLPADPVPRGFRIRKPRVPHGASPSNLLAIFGGQIVVGSLAGWRSYVDLHAGLFAAHPWLPRLLGLVGLAFVARTAWVTTSFPLRALLLFAALHMGAGLASPTIRGERPLWELLQMPGAGQRYWLTMALAFLAAVAWTALADRRRAMRVLATVALALLLLVGIPRDLGMPPREDFDFAAQARRFVHAAPGRIVPIRIPPSPSVMPLMRGCEAPRKVPRADLVERFRARRPSPEL
ncbi:MAG: hypothetical protein FJ148_25445 [Deltaproteobacteria bacterium]|nr:hypothetical protein [Deltaproteobacteria bacterium]